MGVFVVPVLVCSLVAVVFFCLGCLTNARATSRGWQETFDINRQYWKAKLADAERRASEANEQWGNWERFARSLADHLWRLWSERDHANLWADAGFEVADTYAKQAAEERRWMKHYQCVCDEIQSVLDKADKGPA